jgi:hypothetical protein
MKANQLATLVLRLFAIYCLIQFVPTVSILSSEMILVKAVDHSDISFASAFVSALIPSSCWLAVTVLLFVYSAQFGKWLAGDIDEANITRISFEQVQALAFAVAGALIIAEGVSQLFGSVYSALASLKHLNKNQYPSGMEFKDWHSLLFAFGVLLKTALGAWMFFGTRGFVNLWRSLQNFGTPKTPEN